MRDAEREGRVEALRAGARAMSRTQPSGRPSPVELLKLRSATTVYLAMLADAALWVEEAAAVNRTARPDYAAQLERLGDELATAVLAGEMGTVAAVGRVLDELLDAKT